MNTANLQAHGCRRLLVCAAMLLTGTLTQAAEYSHGYYEPGVWTAPSAWVPLNGAPANTVPGAADTAYVSYGISLSQTPAITVSIGTLNLDTYISWGPAPDIDLRGGTLNIMNSGQWQWGGFSDFYASGGTVNLHGTMQLVDDIADHVNNGSTIVNPISHEIQWGTTFNNYGTLEHDSQGAFHLGAGACQYYNHSLHDFTADGDITTGGQGGERTTNLGLIRKSGGLGESFIASEFVNQGQLEVQSGTVKIDNSLDYEGLWTHELNGGKWIARDNTSLVISARGILEINNAHIVLDGANANFYTTQTNIYTPLEDSLLDNAGILEIYGNRTFANTLDNSGILIVGADTTLTADLNNLGVMQVGNSPGHSIVEGDFTQDILGELAIELGGLTPGDLYDVLEITGTATLDGTLDVSYFDSFVASPGNMFSILQASSFTGMFNNVIYPDAQNWFIDYDIKAGRVAIGIVPEPRSILLLLLGGLCLIRQRGSIR